MNDESEPLILEPDREHARMLALQSSAIPLTYSFVCDTETPVSAYLKLRQNYPEGPAFLLESAERGQQVGRYSFIGFQPSAVLRWSLGQDGDPYDLAQELVSDVQQAHLDGLPPFTGGAVGYFGYDLLRAIEPVLGEPNSDTLQLPDMALMLTDALVIFDHLAHRVTILVNLDVSALTCENHDDQFNDAYEAVRDRIGEIYSVLREPLEPTAKRQSLIPPKFQAHRKSGEFESMVEQAISYIYDGDIFQVVPSQRWSVELPCQPFSVYRGLRAVNPSPYLYFIDFEDHQLVGASPEPLLTVVGRNASTKPIAGTRPRSGDMATDAARELELLHDEKERAEHVMLVDLARNDLGQVCEYGSVEVDSYMAIEHYSHVMHMVSAVGGRLADGVRPIDALRAVLPAGTLSGAPKIRAMQIIDELETEKRGPYGGAVGYLSYSGDLDTCIHIRTIVVKDGVAYLQAGGGTVVDAKPVTEEAESQVKAQALRTAIELAAEQLEWE